MQYHPQVAGSIPAGSFRFCNFRNIFLYFPFAFLFFVSPRGTLRERSCSLGLQSLTLESICLQVFPPRLLVQVRLGPTWSFLCDLASSQPTVGLHSGFYESFINLWHYN